MTSPYTTMSSIPFTQDPPQDLFRNELASPDLSSFPSITPALSLGTPFTPNPHPHLQHHLTTSNRFAHVSVLFSFPSISLLLVKIVQRRLILACTHNLKCQSCNFDRTEKRSIYPALPTLHTATRRTQSHEDGEQRHNN
jgi:hypothetical protein